MRQSKGVKDKFSRPPMGSCLVHKQTIKKKKPGAQLSTGANRVAARKIYRQKNCGAAIGVEGAWVWGNRREGLVGSSNSNALSGGLVGSSNSKAFLDLLISSHLIDGFRRLLLPPPLLLLSPHQQSPLQSPLLEQQPASQSNFLSRSHASIFVLAAKSASCFVLLKFQ